MWPNPQKHADLVTYTEEILNRKIYFCAVHPVATTEDLIEYVKPIVCKKNKYFGYTHRNKWFIKWYRYHQEGENSGAGIHEIGINQEIKTTFSAIINQNDNNFAEKN